MLLIHHSWNIDNSYLHVEVFNSTCHFKLKNAFLKYDSIPLFYTCRIQHVSYFIRWNIMLIRSLKVSIPLNLKKILSNKSLGMKKK